MNAHPILVGLCLLTLQAARAQDAAPNTPATVSPTANAAPAGNVSAGNATVGNTTAGNITSADLGNITVIGQLEQARSEILPDLGATAYTIDAQQILNSSQGDNAPFNQVLLRAPGVAEDSLGQLHLRGEHANLQYRINGVLLPEGVTGFGEELDPRFVDSLQLITGSLPAEYGFRTSGIVDIQTKSGAFSPGGEVDLYGGSYDTVRPSFEYGGSQGNISYFTDGSFDHNSLGVENPTGNPTAIHDVTNQYKAFAYGVDTLDETSQLSVMASASYSDFQIPDVPGLAPSTAPGGGAWEPGTDDSSTLNENQNEQNYYAVTAYQKSAGDLNYQIAAFGRYSSVDFSPDQAGDLFFNGVAGSVQRDIYSTGLQGDLSFRVNDTHTVRAGMMTLEEIAPTDTDTTVFNLDGSGNVTGAPYSIGYSQTTDAQFYGTYLQDEWRVTDELTVNYGARFDFYASQLHEYQLSPRINAIYQPDKSITMRIGYSRYFTPPPLESVNSAAVTQFVGTSNAAEVTQDSPVKAERSHYFDAGITKKITSQWQVGADGYYKIAQDQLDDGFFGPTLIPSAFNYSEGRVYGLELTTNYAAGGFSAYDNTAFSVAQGKDIESAQFLFTQADLTYIQSHYVYLDHDQRVTNSAGIAYSWKQARGTTRVYLDGLLGSGLREDEELPGGGDIPNGAHVPMYWELNVGAGQDFQLAGGPVLKGRLDIVNLTDNVYQLRNGTGIGVNAPQYGMRLGCFGTIGYQF
jgi:hypothetical protein